MKIFDYADLGSKRSWDYSMSGVTPEDYGRLQNIEGRRYKWIFQ